VARGTGSDVVTKIKVSDSDGNQTSAVQTNSPGPFYAVKVLLILIKAVIILLGWRIRAYKASVFTGQGRKNRVQTAMPREEFEPTTLFDQLKTARPPPAD
jgi:hypothetical protein